MPRKPKTPQKPREKAPLALSPAAVKLRETLVSVLSDRLKPADMPALETLCRSWVLLDQALAEVEASSIVVTQSTRVTSMNQPIRAAAELRKIVEAGIERFGLSPLDRRKLETMGALGVASDEEEDFNRYLSSRPRSEILPSVN